MLPDLTIRVTVPKVPMTVPAEAVRVIDGLLMERIEFGAQLLASMVSRTAPVNQGHLAQSFQASPATEMGGIQVTPAATDRPTVLGRVFSSLPQAIVMEEGRRPGAKMPPTDAIALWAQRKLGLTAEQAETAAFPLARSIARKGIEGRHYAAQAADQARSQIEMMFHEVATAIERELSVRRT